MTCRWRRVRPGDEPAPQGGWDVGPIPSSAASLGLAQDSENILLANNSA